MDSNNTSKVGALATVENAVLDEQKHPVLAKIDYAGAVVQRDEAEIKLVRKLDWCIMVHGHHVYYEYC